MIKKIVSVMILILLLVSILTLAYNIQPVKAWTGTVYIRADGSIDLSSDVMDYKVYMPKPSWARTFTLDVSSEIVDTILLVQEPHPLPGIVEGSLTYPTEKMILNTPYQIRFTMINKGQKGFCMYGIRYPITFNLYTGGSDIIELDYDETAECIITVIFQGGLYEDTEYDITAVVGSIYGITDEEGFSLTAGADMGVEKTSLTVYTYDTTTGNKIDGLNVHITNENGDFDKTITTQDGGLAIFALEYYEGVIILDVKDAIPDRYENTGLMYFTITSGSNPPRYIAMCKVGDTSDTSLLDLIISYLPYIIGCGIAIGGIGGVAYYCKKKRQRAQIPLNIERALA